MRVWLVRLVLIAGVLVVSSACGSDDDGTPVGEPIAVEADGGIGDTPFGGVAFFGGNDAQCASTELANEPDDQATLADGADCFFSELDSGTPVVWDAAVPTVEGDLIYHRFAYDGQTVLFVIDSRLDTFGAGTIDAKRCQDAVQTAWIPEGIDCAPVDHPGFPEADV